MRTTLRKFLALDAGRRGLALRTAALLLVLRAALAVLPFRAVLRLAEALTPPARPSGEVGDAAAAAEAAWAVSAAGRRVAGRDPCLPQALAALVLLRRRDVPADLRIGVRRAEEGALKAHAWVESGGAVVVGGDVPLEDYVPFPGPLEGRP